MNCLQDYIGLKFVTIGQPKSGLWVNSLPGMSTELAANIGDDDDISVSDTWNDVQTNAYLRLKDDVIITLSETVKLNEVIYQTRRPKIFYKAAPIVAASRFRGVYVQVPESNWVEFYLKEVYIYSNVVASTSVNVFDINDGLILDTVSVTLQVGFNAVAIDKTYSLKKFGGINLFIGVDATGFDTISFLPEFYDFYDCNNMCYTGIQNFHRQPYELIIEAAEVGVSENITFDNLTKYSDGRGIAIGAEVRCSVDEFICHNDQKFTQSWLYLLGAETLFMKLGSPRLNFFSSSNLELTEATRAEFNKRYYSNLKRTLNSIPLQGDSLCFECAQHPFVSTTYTSV